MYVDMSAVIQGMSFTVLLLAISLMVMLHIKVYIDWKNYKRWTKEQEEFVRKLREEAVARAKNHEAGNI